MKASPTTVGTECLLHLWGNSDSDSCLTVGMDSDSSNRLAMSANSTSGIRDDDCDFETVAFDLDALAQAGPWMG